jgi:hypothetical protein
MRLTPSPQIFNRYYSLQYILIFRKIDSEVNDKNQFNFSFICFKIKNFNVGNTDNL